MTPRSMCGLTFALSALAGSTSRDAAAQANPDSVKHRNNCRLASQVVAKGAPDPKRTWAFGYIRECDDPESKAAALAVLGQLRTSTDTSAIHYATAILVRVRDGDIFAATLSIAGDKTASVPMRVFALMALSRLQDDFAAPDYGLFIRDRLGPLNSHIGSCAAQGVHAVPYRSGTTPMPADYRQQIVTIARRVRDDPAEPMHVRSAAACVS